MNAPRYTVIIQWCEEDQHYVVSLPEWGPYCKTHGNTYEEAAKHAREALELLMDGETELPEPKLFDYPGADVVDAPDEWAPKKKQNPKKPKKRQTA
jgi:antitoxin HicB